MLHDSTHERPHAENRPPARVQRRTDRDRLDRDLLAAHAVQDRSELIRLYTLAGDMAEVEGGIDAACFYLTHAFVFALEDGAPEAEALNARLAERGRTHRLALMPAVKVG